MGKKALIWGERGVGGSSKLLSAQAFQERVHVEAEGVRTLTLPPHMLQDTLAQRSTPRQTSGLPRWADLESKALLLQS